MSITKITIIGTINRDIVRFSDGKSLENLGGLMYSILTFAELAPENYRIFPVANIGYDIYEKVCNTLRQYRQIDLSGLKRCDSMNNAVYLNIGADNERDEYTGRNLPEIKFSQIKPFLDSDILMLNMTSGFEFDSSVVGKIIKSSQALTYIDVHSLTLGIDDMGHRYRRKLLQGDRWCKGADFVQLTEDEAWSFHFEQEHNEKLADEVGTAIASRVNRACLMTKGSGGVKIFMGSEKFAVEALPVENLIDTTGCGDVLGASFLLHFYKTGDLRESLNFGVSKAGIKCSFSGIDKMKNLRD
jgi:sugar/nucleoside kinase (ribokinase family)